jgi:hypothetical protein
MGDSARFLLNAFAQEFQTCLALRAEGCSDAEDGDGLWDSLERHWTVRVATLCDGSIID